MNKHLIRQQFRSVQMLRAASAVMAATAIAACGSGASNGSRAPEGKSPPTSPRTSIGSGATSTLAFSTCMRANGVPNFPDLGSHGMLIQSTGQTIAVNGVSVNAPAFQDARSRCQHYLPSQHASPAQAAQQRQQGLEFAKCMRRHGVSNFPDPTVVSNQGGNQVARLTGINAAEFDSPAFQTAAKACGGGPKGP